MSTFNLKFLCYTNIPLHNCGCFATNFAEVSCCGITKYPTSPIEDHPDLHWIRTNQKHFWRSIRGPKLVTFPGVSLQNKYCVKGVRSVCWPCHLCVLVRRIGSRWPVLISAFVSRGRSSLFGSRMFSLGSCFPGTCYWICGVRQETLSIDLSQSSKQFDSNFDMRW